MKFYHSTGTCSLASHIILEELEIPYTPVEVSFRNNLNVDELNRINPLGAVPAIETDDGKTLTQNVAVLEYLADLKPGRGLIGEPGSWERREAISWVALIAADLQKAYSPLFRLEQLTTNETSQKEIETFYKSHVLEVLTAIDVQLSGRDYAVGNQFSIADAYLFTIAGWAKWIEIDISKLKNIHRFMKLIYDRPAVQRALKSEDALDYI
jgi:glutathione S-transferase